MRGWWVVWGLVVWGWGCGEEAPPATLEPAFYHWKSGFRLAPAEQALLDSLRVQRLYVRFFDVDWDARRGEPVPQAPLEWAEPPDPDRAIVPVVFLTNRAFEHLPREAVPDLARRVARKLAEMGLQPPEEVQMDCDWTAGTRDAYFAFLKALRPLLPPECSLSVTVRLHQLKDPRGTGVPPAERGVLMFYNMGRVEDPAEPNSILNLEAARAYLRPFRDYPLPLDLALPLFRWGAVFRDGRLVRLINDLGPEALQDTTRFRAFGERHFGVLRSTYLQGYYLYRGDLLRLEGVDSSALLRALELLHPLLDARTRTLLFYHLDSSVVERYSLPLLRRCIELD